MTKRQIQNDLSCSAGFNKYVSKITNALIPKKNKTYMSLIINVTRR